MHAGYKAERKTHPKDSANILSLLTFSYIYPYIKRGNYKDLNEDDICKTWSKFQSKEMGDNMERLWNQQNIVSNKGNKSIFKLLCDCFLKKYIYLGVFQLVMKLLYITSTPYSVGKLVNYFKEDQQDVTKHEAWMHAGVVIFTNSAYLLYEQHYMLLTSELGIEIVTSLSSMIYRKSLKLSASRMSEISTGKIVTAITKDVVQLEQAVYVVNDLWVELIQAAVVLYLLYTKLGSSGFTGLSIIFIIILLQLYISTSVLKKRQEANDKSDERVQLTQEIVTSIKIMKMYVWEKFFTKKIIRARKEEIQRLRTLAILRWFSSFLGNLSNKLSLFSVIMCYIWFGHTLTAETVYFVATCFQKLRRTLAYIIPACIGTSAEFISSLRRIEMILTAEETEQITQKDSKDSNVIMTPRVEFIRADITINEFPILKNINLQLEPGVNVITGPVGSGKSLLLKAILGEYKTVSGKKYVDGSVSYSPQNPWIFPSSIKQNILFGQPYDEAKYNNILELCALSFDLNILTEGDETLLNDCGVNLSKGQQTRINIARALYKESDIYIFDDSLSSLDKPVSNHIFRHAIQNYLKNKLVILSTHEKIFIHKADNVITMLHGTVKNTEKPIDICFKNPQTDENLLEEVYERNNYQEDRMFIEKEQCSEETKMLPKTLGCEKLNVYYEEIQSGKIGFGEYKKYLTFGGGFFAFIIIMGFFISIEVCSGFSEKFLSKWVAIEEAMAISTSEMLFDDQVNNTNNTTSASFTSSSDELKGMRRSNEFINDTTEFSRLEKNFSDSDSVIEESGNFTEYSMQRYIYINMYSLLIVLSCVLIFISTSLLYVFGLKVSKNLHKSMIANILGAKMSFFDYNMSGTILTRFSKDLYTVDEWVPLVMNESLRMMTMMTATIVLIASINWFFTIVALLLLSIFYFACSYCIRPARTLQRLFVATRSPVVGHLSASLEGLITIRAFGVQTILVDEFGEHLNLMVASIHLFEILMKGLAFSLHMFSALFVSVIILKFLILEADSSSNVGLVITQSFVISSFLEWGLRQWVLLESMMTSFQRATEYTNVEQERQNGQTELNWPSEGCIKYQNVNLNYRADKETVLKNLNFSIEQKEKIGIVGRTGSGKSSIVATLFRLYEVDGNILIDDINIKTVSSDVLRNSIGIIPQDPILFSGSVRENIDPLNKCSDSEIWKALKDVNLDSFIEKLDEDIEESASTFSVGQKQLFCLARAIVRKFKIIILDEATAFMDEETDRLVQSEVGVLFKNCTILTITHNLHSVINYSKVLVMDKGKVIEFGEPNVLLKNKNSAFYKMVHNMKDI